MLPELLDTAEVAHYLKLHPETIKKWIRQGKITGAVKCGNKWRVRSDLLFQDLINFKDYRRDKPLGRPPKNKTPC